MGVVAGVCIYFIAELSGGFLNIPTGLLTEGREALFIVSLSMPAVICASGARGVLEGLQRFDITNSIRVPGNIIGIAAPLVVLPYFPTLPAVVLSILVAKYLLCAGYLAFAIKETGIERRSFDISRDAIKKLLTFGGWVVCTNTIGTLLVYVDRLFIGAMLPVASIAYYVTPWEAISKLWILPTSMTSVLAKNI
jgi:O-antigen/teichoic acid export membrane protein